MAINKKRAKAVKTTKAQKAEVREAICRSHPVRLVILGLFEGDAELCPKDVARAIDQPIPNVSYHMRVLAIHGGLKQTRTEVVRGATKHWYRRRAAA